MRTLNMISKDLTKPWSKSEVKWRVGSLTKDKKKALPLAYVDARTVMQRLDDVLGAENWQDRYEFHGDRVICYLSIKVDEWITKADGAGDTNVEGEKGGISDAFKRAAVKWGMGRELYDIKCRYMPVDEYKNLVGDPWQYVIHKDKVEEPPVDDGQRKAYQWANQFMLKLDDAASGQEVLDMQTEDEKALIRMQEKYPEIANAITKKAKEVYTKWQNT